jgi:mannan endo-1,4-beta-mannosidase
MFRSLVQCACACIFALSIFAFAVHDAIAQELGQDQGQGPAQKLGQDLGQNPLEEPAGPAEPDGETGVESGGELNVDPYAEPDAEPYVEAAAADGLAGTSIYWGAYIQGNTYGVANAPWDTRAIDGFEKSAGKRISILHWGQPWQRCTPNCVYQEFREQKPQFDAMWQRGIIPMVDWASWASNAKPQHKQPKFSLQRITDGSHDAYIHRWAKEAKAWGHPFFLRFNWEMNGDWFPWSEKRNGNKSGQYVAAWRHVRDIFRAEGVTNVKWIWCPNVIDPRSKVPLSHYYPGGQYVDWLCIDGYNWGTNPAKPDRWKSFGALFGPTYAALTRISSRPIMIGEVSSTEIGGSKSGWIADALSSALPRRFPRIRALLWFNWNADSMDWVLESSPKAKAAFAKGISSSYYRAGQVSVVDVSILGRPVLACPADQCLFLPIITNNSPLH